MPCGVVFLTRLAVLYVLFQVSRETRYGEECHHLGVHLMENSCGTVCYALPERSSPQMTGEYRVALNHPSGSQNKSDLFLLKSAT